MATVDSPVAMEVMGQVTMEVDMVVKVDGTEAMGMTLTTTAHHRVTREVMAVETTMETTTMVVTTDDDEQCSSLFFSGMFNGTKVENGRQAGL